MANQHLDTESTEGEASSRPRVMAIWRRPVLGLAPERCSSVIVGLAGILGSGCFRVSLSESRAPSEDLSAKLLQVRAWYGGGGLCVRLPNGATLRGVGCHLDQALSTWLGLDAKVMATDASGADCAPGGTIRLTTTGSLLGTGVSASELPQLIARANLDLLVESPLLAQAWEGKRILLGEEVALFRPETSELSVGESTPRYRLVALEARVETPGEVSTGDFVTVYD